jgi:membrane-anchored protein YejM (alkaline phosphatase superfamily)
VQPGVINTPGSLLDVYPTMASMVGLPYKNYTLGTNLFDSTRTSKYVFISYARNQQPYYALIGDQYLSEVNMATNATALYDLKGDPLKNIQAQLPDTAKNLDNLTRGFFESTRYLMFNNKK